MKTILLLARLRYIILSIVLATIVYPLLSIILLPVWIFRYAVKIIIQRDPKVGEMLTGLDAILVGPDPYKNPVCVLAPYFPLKTKADRNTIVKVIEEQLIKPNHFPNLQQRIVKRYGYYFWYKVENFSAQNHVQYFNPDNPEKPVTYEEFRVWGTESLSKVTFNSKSSPWQWVLIPNFIDTNDSSVKSLVMLNANHCLMDGYSEVKFGTKLSLRPWKVPEEIVATNKQHKDIRDKLLQFCQLVFILVTGPYHAFEFLFLTKDNNGILNEVASRSRENRQLIYRAKGQEPERVHIDRLKAIKNFHGVSMSVLIITLITYAAGKFMKRRFGYIPEKVHLLTPYPLPGHPDAMTNHWSAVRIPVRICENDPVKSMKSVMMEYQKIAHSPAPIVSHYIFKIIGLLPSPFIPKTRGNMPKQMFVMINFPGPVSRVADLFGYDYDDFGFMGSPATGTPFLFSSVSMGGMIKFDAAGLGTILRSQEEANEFTDSVLETLQQMETTHIQIV